MLQARPRPARLGLHASGGFRPGLGAKAGVAGPEASAQPRPRLGPASKLPPTPRGEVEVRFKMKNEVNTGG